MCHASQSLQAMPVTKEQLDKTLLQTFDIEQFISVDPIGIVYQLRQHTTDQLDIELGALFTAMISWGNRKAIRQAALHMLRDEMHWHPATFILNQEYTQSYQTAKKDCVYRTLNRPTFITLCHNINQALTQANSPTLETMFRGRSTQEIITTIATWLSPARLGTPGRSACKRICMYLRWMIRQNSPDLGLWKTHDQAQLYAVMDTHVCQLTSHLLKNKGATWRSCQELTQLFRTWDPTDPLKYDIALMTTADS